MAVYNSLFLWRQVILHFHIVNSMHCELFNKLFQYHLSEIHNSRAVHLLVLKEFFNQAILHLNSTKCIIFLVHTWHHTIQVRKVLIFWIHSLAYMSCLFIVMRWLWVVWLAMLYTIYAINGRHARESQCLHV